MASPLSHTIYIDQCIAYLQRVDPNVSLVELRGEISRQLDGTSLPESYIFLRCVGRYLCTVSSDASPLVLYTCFISHMHSFVGEQEPRTITVIKAVCATSGRLVCTPNEAYFNCCLTPMQAACPEIYLLNASLTEETTSSFPPTHLPPNPLPALHRSPQHTGNQHYPSTYTTSPVSSHHTVGYLSPSKSSHLSPSSHISSASRSQHPHHSTSGYLHLNLIYISVVLLYNFPLQIM